MLGNKIGVSQQRTTENGKRNLIYRASKFGLRIVKKDTTDKLK